MIETKHSNYKNRIFRLTLGLLLYSVGPYLNIQSNIGLAPWEAFTIGVSNITPLSYGTILQLTGLIILILTYFLKEKIGLGTLIDILFIGLFVNFFLSIKIVPIATNFWVGLAMLLIGQLFMAFGSYFYIGSALGCGPRDSLMVALGKTFPKVPIGVIRGMIEGTVLFIGWLLKAKVGIGTVVAVFGIGFMIEYTFKFLRFDVKKIEHESLIFTIKTMFARFKKN
ncbi:MAG: hypothetical protein GXZ18_07190 [Synergistaceae bacterium]|nr:hypothetical protein [Synergistaceae bacterium]